MIRCPRIDFAAVVEAPNNEARSLAVIAEAGRLLPDKQIRYLVNTHHHMDHAGGLRTYLSQGTTIITHESNKQYYLDIMFYPAPRELDPDRMAKRAPPCAPGALKSYARSRVSTPVP